MQERFIIFISPRNISSKLYSKTLGMEVCTSGYTNIISGIQPAFAEKWHSEMSYFHLPIGEMTITLHDVVCLLHLPIRERLLDQSKITKTEATNMTMTFLGAEYDDAFE